MVAPAALRLLPHPASTLASLCKTEVMKGMCPTCCLELAAVPVVPVALHPPSLEAAAMGVLAVQAVLEAAPATPFKA